ncbi:hypothetical protein F8388_013971 [Cannabis sativa]|uniref:Uncharacterized protein n=1 Tax=Cannabis sativa TaxID=3483 RepID=A0A7J6F8B6_CANSA|nr:hypothetical protein F8388_013971 [Cannabis sativa]
MESDLEPKQRVEAIGALLALVAIREGRLQSVASIATLLGCKDVITITAHVSKVENCQRFVDKTINYYGRYINFWGSVYATHFAIPYLKKTKGKIIVISSAATWLPMPRLGLYSATKAAVTSFYETLRVEIGKEVCITIVD